MTKCHPTAQLSFSEQFIVTRKKLHNNTEKYADKVLVNYIINREK
jgi:hypothetical protein